MLVNCTSHKPNIIGNIILWFIKCIESGRHSRLRCQRPLDSIYIIRVFKFHLNKFIHTKDGEMRCEIHTEKQLVKERVSIMSSIKNIANMDYYHCFGIDQTKQTAYHYFSGHFHITLLYHYHSCV